MRCMNRVKNVAEMGVSMEGLKLCNDCCTEECLGHPSSLSEMAYWTPIGRLTLLNGHYILWSCIAFSSNLSIFFSLVTFMVKRQYEGHWPFVFFTFSFY